MSYYDESPHVEKLNKSSNNDKQPNRNIDVNRNDKALPVGFLIFSLVLFNIACNNEQTNDGRNNVENTNQDFSEQSNGINNKYEFGYGFYAKKNPTGRFPFIYNIYNITNDKLEIYTFNENRGLKNLLGEYNIVWKTTNKGSKVGCFNDSNDPSCIVYYNSVFYFQNGVSASQIMSDINRLNDFDGSLITQNFEFDPFSGKAKSSPNNPLSIISSESLKNFSSSISTTYEEVTQEYNQQ